MSKIDEFPKNDNTPAGKEARLARLLKSQRERALSGLMEKLHPLSQEVYMLEFYEHEEWTSFFQKLDDILKGVLSLDPFRDNLALKTECQEVLVLINNKDINQAKRYSVLVNKIFNFFCDNEILIQGKIP